MTRVDLPTNGNDAPAQGPAPQETPAEEAFRYVHTPSFPELLDRLGVSLVATTYQAGKLLVLRAAGGRMSILMRTFPQPMGVAVNGDRLAVGTKNTVWLFRDAPSIAPLLKPPKRRDACYLPRVSYNTGDIRVHELAFDRCDPPGLWVVNTRFSCLCRLSDAWSFVPEWQPPFVSALAPEDRCHLNGLAMQRGRPRYVTALGESDEPEGWRPGKADGGLVLEVRTGGVVARGLSMPHSPRLHAGRLWVLDSGRGRLATVAADGGAIEPVAELPGYTRGLAFAGSYAFVGLSRFREKRQFGGLPLEAKRDELQCGIYALDLDAGRVAGFLKFERGCEELFDVAVMPGLRHPTVIGLEKQTHEHTFVLP